MTTKKLFAVDLDGTLLNAFGEPHAADLVALADARREGHAVTILTGRLYSGTRDAAAAIKLLGPVGCVDGSHVVDTTTHQTLMHHALEGSPRERLLEALQEGSPATFVFANDRIVCDARGSEFRPYVTTWSRDIDPTHDVFEHDVWTTPRGITSIVAIGEASSIDTVCDVLDRTAKGAFQLATFPIRRLGSLVGLVVRSREGDKGSALAWIAEHHGVAMKDTVCIGDWLNDVPMFRVAGRSFAMGQAPAEVKSHASDVLVENSQTGGGVARAVATVLSR